MTRSEAKRHLNFQKWSEPLVFCTFWLRNVLRATTTCTFSTSEPPKVARTCGVLYILTWKCASHNGVHFFDIATSKKWFDTGVFCAFWLGNVLRATTTCTFSTSQLPKVVRHWCVLYIFTSKCASRHNGVHFFDISTSKSGPDLVCFVHFDLEMCFAPQRRALFQHRNFQKWSDTGVFCTFWLGNVLRAKTACNFSSLIWPAGSAPAALASLLFDPPEPQIIGKTQWIATFLPFRASVSSFFWLFLFSLHLPCSAFHLSILSEVWLLNFLRSNLILNSGNPKISEIWPPIKLWKKPSWNPRIVSRLFVQFEYPLEPRSKDLSYMNYTDFYEWNMGLFQHQAPHFMQWLITLLSFVQLPFPAILHHRAPFSDKSKSSIIGCIFHEQKSCISHYPELIPVFYP